MRIGLIFPTALFFFLFGINEISAILFPFLCSIGNIILIYYLGELLFNKNVGEKESRILNYEL